MGQLLGRLWSGEDPTLCPETNSPGPIVFTPTELESYTNNFGKLVGRGWFGAVYAGTIHGRKEINGQRVAVKVSRLTHPAGRRTQWEVEIEYLPRMMHRNIIKLIGYCEAEGKLYLVYPFMPNRNVKSKLSGLDWRRTIKILKGAASAIQELHGHTPPLIYRDLKPDNLLLDKDFNPKLADFGTVTAEGVCFPHGTPGYTEPIVMTNGMGTKPNDIYSLGVVILQLITKKDKVFIAGEGFNWHITDWAKITWSIRGHAAHHKLLGSKGCSKRVAEEITLLALDCAQENALSRPNITQVLQRLAILDGTQKRSRRIHP